MDRSDVIQWRTTVSSQNPELLKKAQEELNENPSTRDQDVQKLREMILSELKIDDQCRQLINLSKTTNADEHLKCPMDDAFLLRFLRVRKFNHERAFKLIQRYFTMRVKYPSIFTSFRPSSLRHLLDEHLHALLPQYDQLGRCIYVIRVGRWDPKISTTDEQLKVLHMSVEQALTNEAIQVNGIIVVYDMKNLGMNQGRHITPSFAKKLASLIQDCLPARFKGFHIVFEPPIFDAIYQIVKPFLNKKTKSRVVLHGHNLESLHKYIEPQYLPKDYGGLLSPIDFVSANDALLAKDDQIGHGVENFGYPKKERRPSL